MILSANVETSFSSVTYEQYVNSINKRINLCSQNNILNHNLYVDTFIDRISNKKLIKEFYSNLDHTHFNAPLISSFNFNSDNNNETVIENLINKGVGILKFNYKNMKILETLSKFISNFANTDIVNNKFGKYIHANNSVDETFKGTLSYKDKTEQFFNQENTFVIDPSKFKKKEDELTTLIKKLQIDSLIKMNEDTANKNNI